MYTSNCFYKHIQYTINIQILWYGNRLISRLRFILDLGDSKARKAFCKICFHVHQRQALSPSRLGILRPNEESLVYKFLSSSNVSGMRICLRYTFTEIRHPDSAASDRCDRNIYKNETVGKREKKSREITGERIEVFEIANLTNFRKISKLQHV